MQLHHLEFQVQCFLLREVFPNQPSESNPTALAIFYLVELLFSPHHLLLSNIIVIIFICLLISSQLTNVTP